MDAIFTGENGPELAMFPRDGAIINHNDTKAALTGGRMISIGELRITVNVPAGSDGREVGKAAAGSLIQTLKTAGVMLRRFRIGD